MILYKQSLIEFKQFIRWNDWALDKLPVLFSICFYLILMKDVPEITYVYEFFVFLVFAISSTIYGYAINNYADLEIDIRAGKNNYFSVFSKIKQLMILGIILVIVFVSGVYFTDKTAFLGLWGLQLFFSTFYSIKPIRFKERGLIGLIIPFIAQLVLPALICFSIFGKITSLEAFLFTLYGFFKGGAYDIGHQFHDYDGDASTNTQTFAVNKGKQVVEKIFKIFLIGERVVFIVILFYLSTIFIDILDIRLNYFIVLLALYLVLLIILGITELKKGKISDPYYKDVRGIANITHIIVPNYLFPIFICVILALQHIINLPLLIFFIVWIGPTPQKVMWPFRAIFGPK